MYNIGVIAFITKYITHYEVHYNSCCFAKLVPKAKESMTMRVSMSKVKKKSAMKCCWSSLNGQFVIMDQ